MVSPPMPTIDLPSLLAGILLTAIGGWITSFIALRKDERAGPSLPSLQVAQIQGLPSTPG